MPETCKQSVLIFHWCFRRSLLSFAKLTTSMKSFVTKLSSSKLKCSFSLKLSNRLPVKRWLVLNFHSCFRRSLLSFAKLRTSMKSFVTKLSSSELKCSFCLKLSYRVPAKRWLVLNFHSCFRRSLLSFAKLTTSTKSFARKLSSSKLKCSFP